MKLQLRLALRDPPAPSADTPQRRRSIGRTVWSLLTCTAGGVCRLLGVAAIGLLALPMTVAFLVIVGALGLLGLIALLHLAWALILLVFWLIDGDQKLLWGALEMFGLACVYNAPAAIAGYFWAGTLDRRRAQHSDAPFKD